MPRTSATAPLATWLLMIGCDPGAAPNSASSLIEDMRLVIGATFRMGTDSAELERIRVAVGLASIGPLLPEVPSHEVTVADFYIDTVDVTNQQFAQFVEATPKWSKDGADSSLHNGRYLEHWADESPPEELIDHPVTFVTWQAAVAFCTWREKRLPTEIEYEWAAQGGVAPTEYPWGNSPPQDSVVNWGGNDVSTTVPVGSYPPNTRGLYDMAGNIWHFTADPWLGSYAEMVSDSMGTEQGSDDPRIRRVVRGGSSGAHAVNLRVRYRDSHRPFDAREMVGFRCAKSAGTG